MAYDLETKEKARMMWLKGKSFEQVADELDINMNTIFNWSVADNWKADIQDIQKKIKEKSNDYLADEIDRMNKIHLAQLAASHILIRNARDRVKELLQRDFEKPHEMRALTGAIRDLAASIDTTLKGERLIQNVSTENTQVTVKGYKNWSPSEWTHDDDEVTLNESE